MKPQGPIGPPTLICFDGQEVVYGVPGDLLGEFAVPFSINGSGEVGFRSEITGGSAVLLADAQQPLQQFEVVARTGEWALNNPNDLLDVLGDVTGGEHVVRFNSLGRSAFRSTTTGVLAEGIWLDDGQGRIAIANGQTPAPGYLPAPFESFNSPAVTSSGAVAFRACIDPGCLQDGVWYSSGGSLVLVARDNQFAPDATGSTSSGERFDSFADPSLGLSGRCAFRAALKGPGSPQGIWRWSPPSDLRRIVRSGDALRGTSLTFSTFEEELAVADSGEIAFVATMSDGKRGLFLTSQVGTIVKVAKVDEAFMVNGASKTISQIAFHPGSSAQGNGGFVQPLGPTAQVAAVAFTLTFTDLSQATILTTLE